MFRNVDNEITVDILCFLSYNLFLEPAYYLLMFSLQYTTKILNFCVISRTKQMTIDYQIHYLPER
jgi:hypothetical protein